MPQHCGEMWIKWHSVLTVKSYFKWMRLCNKLLFSPSCWANMFFFSSCSVVEIHPVVYQYFQGYFARNSVFVKGIYQYFRKILNSVLSLRPCWQPWLLNFSEFLLEGGAILNSCPQGIGYVNSYLLRTSPARSFSLPLTPLLLIVLTLILRKVCWNKKITIFQYLTCTTMIAGLSSPKEGVLLLPGPLPAPEQLQWNSHLPTPHIKTQCDSKSFKISRTKGFRLLKCVSHLAWCHCMAAL